MSCCCLHVQCCRTAAGTGSNGMLRCHAIVVGSCSFCAPRLARSAGMTRHEVPFVPRRVVRRAGAVLWWAAHRATYRNVNPPCLTFEEILRHF
jgi:hypothetical protein